MIFKIFDNNIDKWTAKIGIFGKSFNELGTAVNNAFKSTIDNLDNFDKHDGFWKGLKNNLFPKKDDIASQLMDVMPEINTNNLVDDTEKIKILTKNVANGTTTWQTLFDTLPEGQKHFAQLGQQMEGQIITTESVIRANQQARASALAHNEAIKAQAFSAKAGKAALQGLALAGNMILFAAISKGIELTATATAIDNWIHKSEKAVQAAKEAAEAYKETSSSIDNYTAKYKELREQLLAAKGNEEETYRVKQQLLDLQTELNEKYGEEYGYLNLVTDAYKDKTDAIRELNKEAANEFLNENRSGIKYATKKMEEDNTYYLGSINEVTDAKDVKFIEKIKEITEADGITFNGWDFEFRNNLLL